MRVFVAGATGAIGRQLVPRLVAAGHEVHGMTRSESKQAMLHRAGRGAGGRGRARSRSGRARRWRRAKPDVIVHQLTAIGGGGHASLRSRFRADQPPADRGHRPPALGRAGGRGAAVRGAERTSHGTYARTGGPVKSEEDPLDPTPAREMRETLAAIRHLEEAVLGARVDGGDRAALRRVLRAGHLAGAGRGAVRAGPQAQVPAGRRRWRRVVVHPHRRRRGGDGGGDRARQPRRLQRGRR